MERNKLKYNMTHNGEKPARHGSRLYLPPTNYIVSAPSCSARAIQKKLISERKAIEIFFGKSQENKLSADKWHDRKDTRTRQKNERGDRKGKSNDNPEIPDRAMPSGFSSGQTNRWCRTCYEICIVYTHNYHHGNTAISQKISTSIRTKRAELQRRKFDV